jgi:hypothetical protein
MSESDFWAYIRPKLAPYGHLERLESRTRLGIPDVNYCLIRTEGWWETKYLPRWPRGIVRFNHFTIEQLEWARRRHKAGGRAGLMAQIGRDYLFFDPPAMEAVFEGVSRPVLERLALVRGSRVYPTVPMLKALIRKI